MLKKVIFFLMRQVTTHILRCNTSWLSKQFVFLTFLGRFLPIKLRPLFGAVFFCFDSGGYGASVGPESDRFIRGECCNAIIQLAESGGAEPPLPRGRIMRTESAQLLNLNPAEGSVPAGLKPMRV